KSDGMIESRIQINGDLERLGDKNFIVRGKYGNLFIDVKEPIDATVEVGELKGLEFHDGSVKDFNFLKIVTYAKETEFYLIFTPFREKDEI
ncbi:MAG: hypothetical protein ACP5K2_09525, partial [bacterium]